MYLPGPSLTHHQIHHAEQSYGQHNILHNLSRPSRSVKYRGPVVDLPILVFYDKCQLGSMLLGSEHRPISVCFIRHIHISGDHFIVQWQWWSCSTFHKGADIGSTDGLSSLPICLLKPPPCSWNCAGRDRTAHQYTRSLTDMMLYSE